MNSKIILIVLGEPNSIFSEVLFNYFKSNNYLRNKHRIILIGSKRLIQKQMERLNYSFYINEIFDIKNAKKKKLI